MKHKHREVDALGQLISREKTMGYAVHPVLNTAYNEEIIDLYYKGKLSLLPVIAFYMFEKRLIRIGAK